MPRKVCPASGKRKNVPQTRQTRRVERPYCSGKWTRARYFGFIRSALRKASVKWPPIQEARNKARRPYKGPNKRQRWEYQCALCHQWHSGKDIEVDHSVPCGQLRSFDDLAGFTQRLFCEREHLRVLCKACHQELTNAR